MTEEPKDRSSSSADMPASASKQDSSSVTAQAPLVRGLTVDLAQDHKKLSADFVRIAKQVSSRAKTRKKTMDAFQRLVYHAKDRTHVEQVVWLERLAANLWPHLDKYVSNLMKETVEPALNACLPEVLKGNLTIKNFTLGTVTPHFGPLTVLDGIDPRAVELRLKVQLPTNVHASLVVLGLNVTLSNLNIEGEVSVVFRPLMSRPPFFGGIEVYFINPPQLKDLQFGGAVQIPQGLLPAVRSAIANALGRFLVLPNRIAVDLNEEDDLDAADLKYSDPIAVLQLTILEAKDLAAGDVSLLGTASSDPYVVVTLGGTRWTSPTIPTTLNPVWGEDGRGVTCDLPIHNASQLVTFHVYDEDVVTTTSSAWQRNWSSES